MAESDDRISLDQVLANMAWMRRLAHRLVGDAAKADDVVQQAWVEAVGHAPPAGQLRPWLAGVVKNLARKGHRSDGRRRLRESAVESEAPTPPSDLVERLEIERAVADALLGVDEPYRTTVLLRYFEDLSASEIARRVGIPAATVRWRLQRGLEELRRRLDARFGNDRRHWALALVPTAAATSTGASAGMVAIIGGLVMAKAAKVSAALVVLGLLLLGAVTVWRHVPTGDVTRAPPGVAWRVSGGIGATATVAGVKIPPWFGQRGAHIRRIAGRVTFAGAPVEGATVELGSALSDAGMLAPAAQRTGKDGRFDFGAQPPAAYTVAASERVHIPAVLDVDARDPTLATDKLELRLGGCDAALFGHVNDASGGPVAGARLCYSPPRALACVTTEDSGAYELCVGPRQLAVTVAAQGYGAVNETVRYGGRRVQRDFLLTPEATLTGRVVRADDGKPVAGAWVRSLPDEAPSQRVAAATGTTSDAQGRFALTGLAPGRHRLIAGTDGLASTELVEVNVEAGHGTDGVLLRVHISSRVAGVVTDGRDPIAGATVRLADRWLGTSAVTQPDGSFTLDSVPRGNNAFTVTPYAVEEPKTLLADRPDVSGVRIRVSALGAISGRVTRGGKPVVGAEVNNMGSEPTVLTDGNGMYQLRGLHPAHYQVSAADVSAGAFGTAPDFKLGPGEQRTGVDIDIKYGGTISGTVVEADGKPAAGVYVRFQATTMDDGGDDTTATDGSFRTATLMGGADYVPVVMPARRTHQRFVPAEGAFAPVHLADGDSQVDGVRLVIKREHLKITGRTVDGDGAPLADVRVNALHDGEVVTGDGFYDHPSAISSTDGTFTLAELDAGSYDVEAHAGDGSEGAVKNIEAGAGGLVVKLAATSGIDGTLVGYDVPPSVVASRLVDGMWVSRSFASVAGDAFQLRGLPPGTYQVSALGAGGDAAELQLASGKTTAVTLRNRGAGTVTGRVTDWKSGAPVVGMRCFAGPFPQGGQRPTLDSGNGAYTDGDGRFSMDDVALGPIGVLCIATVDNTSDGVASLTLTAGQPGSCEIQVVVPQGAAPGSIGARLDPTPYIGGRFAAVAPKSAADKAGLRAGDVLATVDGNSVEKLTPVGVLFALMGRPYGTPARLGLVRAGASIETTVVVGPPR